MCIDEGERRCSKYVFGLLLSSCIWIVCYLDQPVALVNKVYCTREYLLICSLVPLSLTYCFNLENRNDNTLESQPNHILIT